MKQHDASLILSKLKQKLVDSNCHPLQRESIALYQHIENTLLSALREHYEQTEQEDKRSDPSSLGKLERRID
jgi:hypothetical protein